MPEKRCATFPARSGCPNPPGPRNPHWCDECDDKRIAYIGKQLEELEAHFAPKGQPRDA